MTIVLDGIHFLVTYRCTYACDHCFVWSSPDAEGTMTRGAAHARHRPGRRLRRDQRVLRGRRAHARVSGRAGGRGARPRPRPGLGSRQQLLLGDHRGGRARLAGAVQARSASRPVAVVLRLLRRGRRRGAACATPCVAAQRARAADGGARGRRAGLPRTCPACASATTSARSCTRAGRPWSSPPGEQARPPETLVTCPFEDFADPGRAPRRLRRRAAALPGHQRRQRVLGRGRRTRREAGLAAVLDAYDPATRPVVREIVAGGPWALARAYGHSPAARALRRRVSPVLRGACGAAPSACPRCWRRRSATAATAITRRRRPSMPSECELFWERDAYAVVGRQAQQEALPQDHLRRAQGARQDRLRHRPRHR